MAGGFVYNAIDQTEVATAEIYGKAIADIMQKDPRVVAITADLAKSTYAPLKVKAGTTTDTSITVSWSKVKVAATSNVIHAATTGGSYTNAEKIKPDETKKTLKKGLSWTINATVVKKDSKKSIKKILDLRFESSNKSVAAVSAKGRVTAKKAGKTTIYVYAQNGVCTSVTVTVTKK